jgi:signal transduction histidine kinase
MDLERRHHREKEKILMDIHDGIGGITTNISLLAEVARKSPDPAELDRTLATIADLSREGLLEIRNLMHGLDDRDLSWHTLIAELRNQGTAALASHGIGFSLSAETAEAPGRPGSLLYLNLFRIYREVLTNAVKHACAARVTADLRITRDRLRLTICDDGKGRVAGTENAKGRGLANIRARSAEIGGTAAISLGQGACVHIDIPLSPASPAKVIEPWER